MGNNPSIDLSNGILNGNANSCEHIIDKNSALLKKTYYKNHNGSNFLMLACNYKLESVALSLIENNICKYNDINIFGITCLQCVCSNKMSKVLDVLFQISNKNELLLDHRNNQNKTALIIACEVNYPEGANKLLSYDPDVNVRDYNGNNALWYACKNNMSDTAISILRASQNIENKPAILKFILDNKMTKVLNMYLENNKIESNDLALILRNNYPDEIMSIAIKNLTAESLLSLVLFDGNNFDNFFRLQKFLLIEQKQQIILLFDDKNKFAIDKFVSACIARGENEILEIIVEELTTKKIDCDYIIFGLLSCYNNTEWCKNITLKIISKVYSLCKNLDVLFSVCCCNKWICLDPTFFKQLFMLFATPENINTTLHENTHLLDSLQHISNNDSNNAKRLLDLFVSSGFTKILKNNSKGQNVCSELWRINKALFLTLFDYPQFSDILLSINNLLTKFIINDLKSQINLNDFLIKLMNIDKYNFNFDQDGDTLLNVYCVNIFFQKNIFVKLLQLCDSTINIVNSKLETLLVTLLKQANKPSFTEKIIVEIVNNMINLGFVNFHNCDNSNTNALMYACHNTFIELINIILNTEYSNPNVINIHNNTALMIACQKNLPDGIIIKLIKLTDEKYVLQVLPMLCLKKKESIILNVLEIYPNVLQNNVTINIKDNHEISILCWAIENKFDQIICKILSNNKNLIFNENNDTINSFFSYEIAKQLFTDTEINYINSIMKSVVKNKQNKKSDDINNECVMCWDECNELHCFIKCGHSVFLHEECYKQFDKTKCHRCRTPSVKPSDFIKCYM